MARQIDMTAALALADRLDALLKEGVPSRHEDPGAHEKALAALEALVTSADPKGRLDQDWNGGVMRAFGLRATSTSGITGACQNWIQQVRTKSTPPRHPSTSIGE